MGKTLRGSSTQEDGGSRFGNEWYEQGIKNIFEKEGG